VLRAAGSLNNAALGAMLFVCLSIGFGDVAEQHILTGLRALLWLAIALGVVVAVRARSVPPSGMVAPLGAWLAVQAVSALLAPSFQAQAVGTLVRPVSGVLLAWSVYAVTPSREGWRLVGRALGLGGLLVALIGLAEVVGPAAVRSWLDSLHDTAVPVADVPRLASLLSHPNVAASVLELTLPLLVATTLTAPRPWQHFLTLTVLAQLAALGLTFSRAGLLAAVASLVVLSILAASRGARHVVAPVGLVALAAPITIGLAAFMLPQVERRLVAELEQGGYRATYTAPPSVSVAPDQVVEIPITVTNLGPSEWSALDSSRVALGYHLMRSDGKPLEFDSPATLLPANVPAQSSLQIIAHLRAPPSAGLYVVEWDAMREGVAWFSWRGSPTTATSLLVDPNASVATAAATSEAVVLPRPGRVQYWLAAWSMLGDFPVLGVGPDNYRLRFTDYTGSGESHVGTHAHSLYLEALANTGTLGLLALCGLLGGLLWVAWRGLTRSTEWLWRSALLASLVAWLVHGTLDDFERFTPTHLAFWVVVGLLARGSVLAKRLE
jgi:hypothetical protein